jgi:hypothetical protein
MPLELDRTSSLMSYMQLRDEMNKIRFHVYICFEEFLNQLNLLYIYIYLYLQYILN